MWSFVKQFVLHPKQVGSVLPSGPELAGLMIKPIDFKKAKHIVELGPGTGIITEQILKHMRKDATLTVIEINKKFCEHLNKNKDPRLKIIEGDASKLTTHVSTADYVVSGLPLANFSKEATIAILEEIKKIKKYAYIQYHYSPIRESYYKQNFKNVKRKITLKNIPPAFVYVCT